MWQKAHRFVLSAYRVSGRFPNSWICGLTSQFRRAAVSIPANIAEGFKRKSKPDTFRFMTIAQWPLEGCRYDLMPARALGDRDTDDLMIQLEEVGKLLEDHGKAVLTSDYWLL